MALIRLTLDGNRVTKEERIKMGKRIRDVAQASDGAVLLLVDGDKGELLRLTPATEARPSTGGRLSRGRRPIGSPSQPVEHETRHLRRLLAMEEMPGSLDELEAILALESTAPARS